MTYPKTAQDSAGNWDETQPVAVVHDLIGTRRYGTPLSRVAVAAAAAESAAVDAGEVLLHASTRCFVDSDVVATVNSIPLEAGEKFHMRIEPGSTISVLRDTADGFLNVIPVAG